MGTIDSCSSTDIVRLFPRGTIGYSSNVIVSHGNATEYNSDFSLREQIAYYWWILPRLLQIQANSFTLPRDYYKFLLIGG